MARDDLIDPRPLAWESWTQIDETTIEVTLTTGPQSCVGVSATVTEDADTVTIDLAEGAIPGADGDCPAMALRTTLRVTLDEPLGDRSVTQTEQR